MRSEPERVIIFHRLEGILRLAIFDAGIQILLVLADDNEVHVRMHRLDIRVIAGAGAHVGIEAERFAHGHVERFVAAALRGGDGGLEQHFGAADGIPRLRRDTGGDAFFVEFLADFDRVDLERAARLGEDFQHRFHDLRPDTVAIRNRDGVGFQAFIQLDDGGHNASTPLGW